MPVKSAGIFSLQLIRVSSPGWRMRQYAACPPDKSVHKLTRLIILTVLYSKLKLLNLPTQFPPQQNNVSCALCNSSIYKLARENPCFEIFV